MRDLNRTSNDVTIEEAQKYAGDDREELNMVFQFEHVEIGGGDYGKWTTERYDFKEFKKIMIKWQEELAGKAWNSLFLGNHDQPRSVSRFGNGKAAAGCGHKKGIGIWSQCVIRI